MGTRGPVPKRDSERRRRNIPEQPTDHMAIGGTVRVPRASSGWHTRARAFWRAAAKSGQSQFYEPTDWQMLAYVCDLMTTLFRPGRLTPQMEDAIRDACAGLGLTKEERLRLEWLLAPVRPSAQMVASINSLLGSLLVTEGDRRRARLELERPGKSEEDTPDAADIDEERRRRIRACK